MKDKQCLFCNQPSDQFVEIDSTQSSDPILRYECKTCGCVSCFDECTYMLSSDFLAANKHIISGYFRELKERNIKKLAPFSAKEIMELPHRAEIPKTIPEKINKLILHMGKSKSVFGFEFVFTWEEDYSLAYATDPGEFRNIYNFLLNEKIIEKKNDSMRACSLSMKGWNKFYALESEGANNKTCFIAINFDTSLNEALCAIKETILNCDYEPYCLKGEHSNDQITDRIIAGINKSKFLIAEFTGQKQGVYYEAGYAKGQRKDVIWLCKKDDADHLHFDTRQYNHILWENISDLKTQLKDRILATIR